MNVRTGIGAVLSGALISLAGTLAAALLVVILVVSVPDLGASETFFWASVAAAILLQSALAFAGTRFATRRLAGASGWRAACLACAGPVAMSLLTQAGIAAEGRPEWLLLTLCGTLLGSLIGFRTAAT